MSEGREGLRRSSRLRARPRAILEVTNQDHESLEMDEVEVRKPQKRLKKRVAVGSDESSFSPPCSEPESEAENEHVADDASAESKGSSDYENVVRRSRLSRSGSGNRMLSAVRKKKSSTRTKNSHSKSNEGKETKSGAPGHILVPKDITGRENELSSQQKALLSLVFSQFDVNENGRITLTDLLRVSDDHGVILTIEEARDMLRFWDTSGTSTISTASFVQVAQDCKFIVAPSK